HPEVHARLRDARVVHPDPQRVEDANVLLAESELGRERPPVVEDAVDVGVGRDHPHAALLVPERRLADRIVLAGSRPGAGAVGLRRRAHAAAVYSTAKSGGTTTSSAVTSWIEARPSPFRVSSMPARRIWRTLVTPASPFTARPQRYARPIITARAPSAT